MTSASKNIENWIADYRRHHPDYVPPQASQHPMTLALSTELQPFLMDFLGGLEPYWQELSAAAKLWFAPKDESLECNYFRGSLFAACGMSQHTDHAETMGEIYNDFRRWDKTLEV